ncbi:Hypothetical predicted protein [Paramuricea clavata]|uniref:Reverse transcriptase zinc-binding domain-containing protein n=1 Tax=Paramuricea clavata TaxID=317549 RepID=A0A7D9EGJ8_PARCT|nr:Hypothetical predicted protein [Paramuricea clavata]
MLVFTMVPKCKDPIMGRDYSQIQGNIEEMGITVSDVTREDDGDWEFGGFDAWACGKDITLDEGLCESEAPWKDFMRYYIGRALGINDNSRPNSDIPTPFYSHLLVCDRECAVDLGQPCTSKMYYLKRLEDCVTPVQVRSELAWNQRFDPGLIWKEIWKDVAGSFNDPLLRDFDWRTVHRVLPVNFRVHKWYSRISSPCARCGERVELTLEHTLIHCPMHGKRDVDVYFEIVQSN